MTGQPVLSLQGVTVRYPNSDVRAVEDLTISIGANERVALIGPSGAGKSTVLRLASGLTLPTQGTVQVLGVDTAELGRRSHRGTRRRIGIISQDFSLVGPLRVANNVAAGRLGSWSWLRAMRSLIRPSPIDEIAHALDQVGIADKIWDRADRLSGGQQQRTAIARALFQAPDLLLADEPVSALDPARSNAVMTVLVGATQAGPTQAGVSQARSESPSPRAFVASMHDAPLALRHCDRIIALRQGRLHFDLPSSQVTPDLLTELYLLDEQAPA